MHTLREQFDIQCRMAATKAKHYGRELDAVIVRHKGYLTRISIIGNAISRSAYELWRADGSNVRCLCVFDEHGNLKPKQENP